MIGRSSRLDTTRVGVSLMEVIDNPDSTENDEIRTSDDGTCLNPYPIRNREDGFTEQLFINFTLKVSMFSRESYGRYR